jgi:glycosyltransferase involved in cell wall biosynthesis
VADAVTLPGPRYGHDLAELYRAADVVVNLSVSHQENVGLSQAEAQACGVLVVCAVTCGR